MTCGTRHPCCTNLVYGRPNRLGVTLSLVLAAGLALAVFPVKAWAVTTGDQFGIVLDMTTLNGIPTSQSDVIDATFTIGAADPQPGCLECFDIINMSGNLHAPPFPEEGTFSAPTTPFFFDDATGFLLGTFLTGPFPGDNGGTHDVTFTFFDFSNTWQLFDLHTPAAGGQDTTDARGTYALARVPEPGTLLLVGTGLLGGLLPWRAPTRAAQRRKDVNAERAG